VVRFSNQLDFPVALKIISPEIKELDLNPIFAYRDGAIVVDARVILEPSGDFGLKHPQSQGLLKAVYLIILILL